MGETFFPFGGTDDRTSLFFHPICFPTLLSAEIVKISTIHSESCDISCLFDNHIETFQMSEEELSEGSLGLRARGSSRATSHGQVLIQGSDNDGEREVPEEEGLEEEEVCEALLQLLEHDLLACDVQLSLFVAAATSYRQV